MSHYVLWRTEAFSSSHSEISIPADSDWNRLSDLHFNLMFPVKSLVLCSHFLSFPGMDGVGRSEIPRGKEAVPTVILSRGRSGRLGEGGMAKGGGCHALGMRVVLF